MSDNNFSDKDLIFLIAELKSSITNLNSHIEEIKRENKELKEEIKEIRAQINRWRGALPVIIAIGGLIGFVVTIFDKFKGFFF